ncbi:MAG: DUF4268 domain-containing protein [Candidatus Poribacteria bacterium]|nr:DUF4268 domain-containing protein [Candidatus Poribacteria bacterium]MDE0470131.1 DUF4268 domain-containing protein [Candidatus Poribacteria bacterium]
MLNFSELKRIPLREKWNHEASDFTPWLESNIQILGDALGMDLEVVDREASVGDFSLDLLAKDLGSSRTVIIENQLTQTDHDHLGKLLTYAAGFDASIVVWVSEEVRDEHRQAMEWLNQRTDTETQFFAVVPEVLQIDNSNPAFEFKLVVSPNEWQKSKRQKPPPDPSFRGEKYKSYTQMLIDELREKHKFTGARAGQPYNWYTFSSGIGGIGYGVQFARGDKVFTYVNIRQGVRANRLHLFDTLEKRREKIESNFGSPLEWNRAEEQQNSWVGVSRDGNIELSDDELEEIREWHIENLLKLKEVFQPEIERALKTLE